MSCRIKTANIARTVLIYSLLVTLNIVGYAQPKFTLNFTVLNSDNPKEPIIGAVVVIKNYGMAAATDADGKVAIRNLPKGKAQIEVSYVGFQKIEREIDITKDEDLTLKMVPATLQAETVEVTAKASKAGTATSSIIGRQAIDHLQAMSLKDLMQLIPGQLLTGTTDMTQSQKVSIRSINNDNNNSFGTAIVVDGVPVSDNNTLNSKVSITQSTAGSGVDLRSIPTDNIESVEVIRGIPSVEYGDLSSGAVVVNTRAGQSPYEVRAKINPTTINASLGKGWKLSNKKGALNFNVDYVQAWGDPRKKTDSYDRYSIGVNYTNTFWNKWYTNTKIFYNGAMDNRKQDPDQIADGTELWQKISTLRITHNGTVNTNKLLSRSLVYSLGYTTSVNESRRTTIVSADGGLPIITAMNSGYFEVPYITSSYYASGGNESKPRSFFAKLSNNFYVTSGKINQRFNMGVEYRHESNNARGSYDDNPLMPIRPNTDGRPRPFYDIPALQQLSVYLEDNFSWRFTDKISLRVQAGLRFSMMQPGMPEQVWALSPRFNAALQLSPTVTIKGGWGQSAKSPGLEYLYPEAKYMDRKVVEYLPANVAEQLVVYYTYVQQVERSNMLKNAVNNKTELGAVLNFKNGIIVDITAYRDMMKGGFGNYSEFARFLSSYYTAGVGVTPTPGGKPIVDWNKPTRVDTVYTTTGRVGNTASSLNQGVEFSFMFPQIKAIRTQFTLSGAYLESESWDSGPNYANPDGIPTNSPYGQGGANTPPFKLLYPSALNKSVLRRFNTTLRAVVFIPKAKMVASIAGQMIWYNYSNSIVSGAKPIAWIDNDSKLTYNHITQQMLDDPNYKIKGISLADQIKKDKPATDVYNKPLWIINARLTKDISKNVGFSFFVNNVFYYTPYQSNSASGTPVEKNSGTFSFGMELFIKI